MSRDSLSFQIPLKFIADQISDEKVASTLYDLQYAEFKAEYEFSQIEEGGSPVCFVLLPKKIIIPVHGNTPQITIVFAHTFGGDFEKWANFIMFNVSPKEVWVGDTKLDSFKQLVYHFRGAYE